MVDGKPYDLDCHWEMRLDSRAKPIKDRHRAMSQYVGDSNFSPGNDSGAGKGHKVHVHRHKVKDVE